jgi:predicted nucleic acid-binding protein
MRYFDTAILLKLYIAERRDTEAQAWVYSAPHSPHVTPLHELELKSAIRQKAGRGEITGTECQQALSELTLDLFAGAYNLPWVDWSEVFSVAESLSNSHGIRTLCRSLDTLHVAMAVVLGATEFCTFDHRQALMAKAAGMDVVPSCSLKPSR